MALPPSKPQPATAEHASALSGTAAGTAEDEAILAAARRRADEFLAGELEALRAQGSPAFQSALSLEALARFRKNVQALGAAEAAGPDGCSPQPFGVTEYRRPLRFAGQPQRHDLVVMLDGAKRMVLLTLVPVDVAAIARGEQFTRSLLAGEGASLHAKFSPSAAQAIPLARWQAFCASLRTRGEGRRRGISSVETKDGLTHYRQVLQFSRAAQPDELVWRFNAAGEVQGVTLDALAAGEAASSHLDYRTRTDLRLPFDGAWAVVWGGRTVAENYHAAVSDQRFAYDLVQQREGRSHRGDGKQNTDYYCFGQPIVAPGAGVVVTASDGVADNVPGVMNASQPCGNYVVIDHGNGEYSFLAHLQKGSVAVRAGQRVAAGERLGRCGNSGNSSEAHLHYHMQTTPTFGAGEGLPAQFQRYRADGAAVLRGEPGQGQVIQAR